MMFLFCVAPEASERHLHRKHVASTGLACQNNRSNDGLTALDYIIADHTCMHASVSPTHVHRFDTILGL